MQKGRNTPRLLNAYIILFAKEKLSSSVVPRIILALGSHQTSQHLSKRQSRAVAMNKQLTCAIPFISVTPTQASPIQKKV